MAVEVRDDLEMVDAKDGGVVLLEDIEVEVAVEGHDYLEVSDGGVVLL